MAGRKNAPVSAPKGNDRNKALEVALSQIDKQFGKGSVMRLGDDSRPPVQVIPTGSLALDVALGIGGLPRGRVIEIYGPESSLLSTLSPALKRLAVTQRSLTLNMLLTRYMQRRWVLIRTLCWFLSPTLVNRPLKLRIC